MQDKTVCWDAKLKRFYYRNGLQKKYIDFDFSIRDSRIEKNDTNSNYDFLLKDIYHKNGFDDFIFDLTIKNAIMNALQMAFETGQNIDN